MIQNKKINVPGFPRHFSGYNKFQEAKYSLSFKHLEAPLMDEPLELSFL